MPVKRRISQTTSLLLLHSSFWVWAQAKWLCSPVLSCHSCALAWFACPVGVFVHYSSYQVFPFLAVGTVLLVGVLFGRILCGWVCPFGLLLDLVHKIPSPKFTLPGWTGYLKFVVLALMVVLLPYFLGDGTWFSFCRVCPASALQVTIPNFFVYGFSLNGAKALKLAALVAVLVLGVFSSRSFCKMLCPIGAMLAPLNYISLWAIKPPVGNCRGCGRCDTYCPTGGQPSSRIREGVSPNRAMECVVCHDCQDACLHKENQGQTTN